MVRKKMGNIPTFKKFISSNKKQRYQRITGQNYKIIKINCAKYIEGWQFCTIINRYVYIHTHVCIWG